MSAYTRAPRWYRRQGERYVATAPLMWEVGRKGSGLWFTVPIGAPFDMSIPIYLWWLFDRHDPRFLKAAALHDHALATKWDRVSSAALFADALKADGVSRRTRLAMTIGVIAKGYT